MDYQPQAEAQDQAAQGFEISLSVLPDGTINVSSGPLDESGEPGEGAGQAVESIGEAIKLVMQLYRQGGASESDDEFAAGFGSGPKDGAPPVERGMTED